MGVTSTIVLTECEIAAIVIASVSTVSIAAGATIIGISHDDTINNPSKDITDPNMDIK